MKANSTFPTKNLKNPQSFHTLSAGTPVLPAVVKAELQDLLSSSPLLLADLDKAFLRRFGRAFQYRQYGFVSMFEVLRSMSDSIAVEQTKAGSLLVLRKYLASSTEQQEVPQSEAEEEEMPQSEAEEEESPQGEAQEEKVPQGEVVCLTESPQLFQALWPSNCLSSFCCCISSCCRSPDSPGLWHTWAVKCCRGSWHGAVVLVAENFQEGFWPCFVV